MTMQTCDTCKIEGRTFYFTDPMSERPTVAGVPEFVGSVAEIGLLLSCNWRGYVADWRIESGILYLDNLSGKFYLHTGKPVAATWVTGEFEASAIENDYPCDPDGPRRTPTRERYSIKVMDGYVIGLVYYPSNA